MISEKVCLASMCQLVDSYTGKCPSLRTIRLSAKTDASDVV